MAEQRIAHSIRAAGAGLLLVLWMEQQWAAHHDFPSFPDLDPSGTFGDPRLPERSIALFGDSTITGPGLESADDIWIRQMLPELTQRYRIRIESFASGGARVGEVLSNQLPRASRTFDLALVSAGSNDALRGMTQFQMRNILREICTRLLQMSSMVILAGAGDIGTAPRLPSPLSAIATSRARATDNAHSFAASHDERILHLPMWELTTPAYRNEKDIFSPDRFHPNRRGHQIWAEAALPTVMEALEGASHSALTGK